MARSSSFWLGFAAAALLVCGMAGPVRAEPSSIPKANPGGAPPATPRIGAIVPPIAKAPPQTYNARPLLLSASDFTSATTDCAGLTPRSVTVSANLTLSPILAANTNGPVLVETWVDGRAQGSVTYPVAEGRQVAVRRTITVSSVRPHTVEFRIGSTRTQVFIVTPACASLAPMAPGVVKRPDLAIGDMVIFQYAPPIVYQRAPEREGYVSLGARHFGITPARSLIVTDFNAPVNLYAILPGVCPARGEAFATVRLWVALKRDGADPAEYLNESLFKFSYDGSRDEPIVPVPGERYMDTRFGSPAPNPDVGEIAIPTGKEFWIFDRVLPCTESGRLEVRLDAENRLQEANEANNVLSLRYRTKQP